MLKLKQTFKALDPQGKAHKVNVYVNVTTVRTLNEPPESFEGLKSLRLDNGHHVNYIEKGEYEVVETGVTLRSSAPDAP